MKFRIVKVQTPDGECFLPERLYFGIYWGSILDETDDEPTSLKAAKDYIEKYKIKHAPKMTIIPYDD